MRIYKMLKVIKWTWELIDDLAKAATSSGRVEILPKKYNDDGTERYYTLAEAIEAGVDYYDDDDGILQRVDERVDENGRDIS